MRQPKNNTSNKTDIPTPYKIFIDPKSKTKIMYKNKSDIMDSPWGLQRHRQDEERKEKDRQYRQSKRIISRSVEVMKLIYNKTFLHYGTFKNGLTNTTRLYAKNDAFLLYFDILTYEKNLIKCERKKFEKLYTQLHKNLYYSVSMSQVCYLLEVNHQQNVEKCAIVRARHWKVDISFEEWTTHLTEELRFNGKLPLVAWLEFRPIDEEDSEIGCFAKRDFSAGEIIALFWGKKLNDDDIPSPYAFKSNKYGTYDALRGFYGDGAPVYNMGVHIMRTAFFENEDFDDNNSISLLSGVNNDADISMNDKDTISLKSDQDNKVNHEYDIINAVLCEDFIVRSLREIECDEEIVISYDRNKITRPGGNIKKAPSTIINTKNKQEV